MNFKIIVAASAAVLILAPFAMPDSAQAHRHHHWHHHRGGDIAAGLVIGAMIGGAVANSVEADRDYGRSYHNRMEDHANWCRVHYRSYDAGSDTYIASTGRRVACNSPYD